MLNNHNSQRSMKLPRARVVPGPWVGFSLSKSHLACSLMKTRSSKLVRFFSLLFLAVWALEPRGVAQTPAGLDIELYAGLTITGAVGIGYQIQYVNDLAQTESDSALR